MDKVIEDLNNYVNKLQKTAESQKRLDETIDELLKIKTNVKEIENTINDYTNSIQTLEQKHDVIKSQFATVLQDYKKLHSAFELLEIELKKTNVHQEKMQEFLSTLLEVSKATSSNISKINISEEKILQNQQESLEKQDKYFVSTYSSIQEIKNTQSSFQKELLQKLNNSEKKNKIYFAILTAIGGIVFALAIVGLFI